MNYGKSAAKLRNKVPAFLVVEVMLIRSAPNRFVIAPAHELPNKPQKVNNIGANLRTKYFWSYI